VNRVSRSLRQKRVMLNSITEPLNDYKYALRRAYRINVYKYTSRRAYKTTTSFFSLKHRLLYASYRRVFPLRGTSLFFYATRRVVPFFLSLDFDDNPKSIINKNLHSITRFFYYLRLSNLLRGSRRLKIQLRIVIYD
jgi:hypothetical protein